MLKTRKDCYQTFSKQCGVKTWRHAYSQYILLGQDCARLGSNFRQEICRLSFDVSITALTIHGNMIVLSDKLGRIHWLAEGIENQEEHLLLRHEIPCYYLLRFSCHLILGLNACLSTSIKGWNFPCYTLFQQAIFYRKLSPALHFPVFPW